MTKMSKLLRSLGLLAALCGSAYAADIIVPRTITANTTWTKDNTYILEGYTFVVAPAQLTIQPGTVIKGRQTTGSSAAALIITRGAKIDASGTAEEPIIFTSILDQLNGNLKETDTQLWGGVIILGNAAINSRANSQPAGTPPQDQVEGLSVTGAEAGYATFGGTNDNDNSGTLRYVSIRHGGAVIGGDNEINGLTLGGVGRATTIEYIEVFANKDDSIEFFGGTVNVRYFVSAFGNDDGIDYDQGWRGKIQFALVLGTDITNESLDKAGEWDGATSPVTATPIGGGELYNLTFIGIGTAGRANTALNIRDNAIAKVYNSVFVDFAKMIDIENDNSDRFNAGDVDFKNNVWWSHISANNTAAGFNARPTGTVNPEIFWTDASRNNTIADPQLTGISRTANKGFDPRPRTGSPALTAPFATVPNDGFFTQANYKGAFSGTELWIAGWTKLARDGYLVNAQITLPPSSGSTRLFNMSVNTTLAVNETVTPGFVIEGTGSRNVLIRAVGPGLTQFGVSPVVADPTITLNRITGGVATVVATNDNWASSLSTTFTRAGAFSLTAGSTDAALQANLLPGSYTITVAGKTGNSGQVIVEVYELP